MKHIHYTKEPAQDVCDDGARNVKMSWVLGQKDGAEQFYMRILTFGADAASPFHDHPWEHQNYVISGTGEVEIDGAVHPLAQGDVILVPSNTKHQYRSKDGMEMICSIPATPKA